MCYSCLDTKYNKNNKNNKNNNYDHLLATLENSFVDFRGTIKIFDRDF